MEACLRFGQMTVGCVCTGKENRFVCSAAGHRCVSTTKVDPNAKTVIHFVRTTDINQFVTCATRRGRVYTAGSYLNVQHVAILKYVNTQRRKNIANRACRSLVSYESVSMAGSNRGAQFVSDLESVNTNASDTPAHSVAAKGFVNTTNAEQPVYNVEGRRYANTADNVQPVGLVGVSKYANTVAGDHVVGNAEDPSFVCTTDEGVVVASVPR